ncbi:MAG: ABC transporter permease [Gemmatimonadaceae bacterium]
MPTILLRMAANSIVANKLRTLLTMLGIVIGVGAVIVMVAIGNGAKAEVRRQIRKLGTNMIVLTAGSTSQGGASKGAQSFNRLTVDDAEKIRRESTLLIAVSPVVMTGTQVIGGSGNWRSMVNGVSTDYLTIRNWAVASGAPFSDDDVAAKRKVVVLGATVASKLFPGGDAVGAPVQLDNTPFTVVGVLEPKGQTASGADEDDVVLVPYTTAHDRLNGFSIIGQIIGSTADEKDVAPAQEEVKAIMREAHGLGPNGPDDFTVRDQTAIVRAATSSTSVMAALLAAIASISLLVGGIGIMNIMLVSVTERTREIGIRMAVGARAFDVLMQFLVESVMLCVAGGVVGLVLGVAGAALLGRITGWTIVTPTYAVFMAIGFSAAVGIFFGYYPARKAASLDPIEALRYE